MQVLENEATMREIIAKQAELERGRVHQARRRQRKTQSCGFAVAPVLQKVG
jgi:hypothetical protein